MKKGIMIGSAAALVILVVGLYYYRSQKIAQAREIISRDMEVFFNYAQEQLPIVTAELEKTEKESPQDEKTINRLKEIQKTYTIAQAIAQADLKTLEVLSPEELQFKNGQIWVDAEKFQDRMEGKLSSRIIGGENAIAFVLFHSALDKTQEDKDKTTAMLKILFDKKLNPNTEAGEVFWVKNSPSDTSALDYVSLFSLSEAAQIYGFPEAERLLDDYIKNYGKD